MTPIVLEGPVALKSYRFLGEEAEALGRRLDSARQSLKKSKTEWTQLYWKSVVDRLTLQWQHLPVLHDADAQTTIIPRWTVSYEFYERDDGIGQNGIGDKIFNRVFREPSLDASWEREINRQLTKARSVL